MAHLDIQEVPNPEGFTVEAGSDFEQNRAMQARAQEMMSSPNLPQVARDVAKSDMIHYSMENIRSVDPATSEAIGKVALGEQSHLESSVEQTIPPHLKASLSEIEKNTLESEELTQR